MKYDLKLLGTFVTNESNEFEEIIAELEAVEDKTQMVDHVCDVLQIIEQFEFTFTVQDLLEEISK